MWSVISWCESPSYGVGFSEINGLRQDGGWSLIEASLPPISAEVSWELGSAQALRDFSHNHMTQSRPLHDSHLLPCNLQPMVIATWTPSQITHQGRRRICSCQKSISSSFLSSSCDQRKDEKDAPILKKEHSVSGPVCTYPRRLHTENVISFVPDQHPTVSM